MASGWYNKGKAEIGNGGIVYLTDTIKVMLVTAAYTPSPDHNFVSDVVANELSGTGYTGGFGGSGRKTLASKTVTENDTDDCAYFDAADVLWAAINAGTPGYAILIKEITNDAASKLLAWVDIPDTATVGTDLTVVWNALGILKLA